MTLEVTESACVPPASQPAPAPRPSASPPAPGAGTATGRPLAGAIGLSALAAAALAACGGGSDGAGVAGTPGSGGATPGSGSTPSGSGGSTPGTGGATPGSPGTAPGNPGPAPAPPAGPSGPIAPEQAARFLHQAQFSSSDEEIEQVRSKGYEGWLTAQMALPPTQSGWDWLIAGGYNSAAGNMLDNDAYADYMVWYQLMQSSDAMRKRVALALSEIMVVSTTLIEGESCSFAMAAYWDLLNRNAFGNFRKLLGEITLNPAMGIFLNTLGNQKEDAATGRQPDENYAREVMQLFTIGLYQLNADGTPRLGANGRPIETYGQDDVSNLARVFTGYVLDPTGHVKGVKPERYRNPMMVKASQHSTLDAAFLGTTIAGSTPPQQKLDLALDTLFNHPNTAPFIGRQLIQRLVTSAPSPAYVGRVAAAFANNGAGVRGDLAAVVKAILLDPEARQDPAQAPPAWGKLREPMIRCVQWARTFGAAPKNGAPWLVEDQSDPSEGLGQSPLRSPSVFNFFRPGYVPPGTALAPMGHTAPEFQITTENSVAGYANFMRTTIEWGVGSRETRLTATYPAELALVEDPDARLARLHLLLTAHQLSPATVQRIRDAIVTLRTDSEWGRNTRVWAAILMVMCCPEYLVQK